MSNRERRYTSKPLQRREVMILMKHYTTRGIKNYFKRHYPVFTEKPHKTSYTVEYYPYLGMYDLALYLGLLTANMCKKYKCPVKPNEKPIGSVWTSYAWHYVYDRVALVKNGSIDPNGDRLKSYLKENIRYTKSMESFDGRKFQYIDGEVVEVNKC